MYSKSFLNIIKIFLILNIFIVFTSPSYSQNTKNQIVVKFKSYKTITEAKKIFLGLNSAHKRYNPSLEFHVVSTPSRASNQAIINKLKQRTDVEWAEEDFSGGEATFNKLLTPNDPSYGLQYINAHNVENAWNITTGSSSLIVAVSDTGVKSTHEDIQSKMVPGYHYSVTSDGTSNGSTDDVYGHGTPCAGCAIAIGNNGLGVTGVNWNSKLMPLRFCAMVNGSLSGWNSDAVQVIDWGVTNGARIFSHSFGGDKNRTWANSTMDTAYKKIVAVNGAITVCAGNQNTFFTEGNNPNMICLAALNQTGTDRASFSNYGYYIDCAAIGDLVYSTSWSGGYGYFTGTSFSTPITAGVLSLMKSINPNLTYTQMRRMLLSTCIDMGTPGYDIYFGWGKVDAYAAVLAAQAGTINDVLNPGCFMVSPTNGSTLTGTISIDGRAMDNFDISKVELFVDGSLVKSLTKNVLPGITFTTTLNTASYSNGSHTIYLKATDITGLTTNSTSITATFSNNLDTTAPTVVITNPVNGSTVSGTISATVTSSDNIAVTKVEYLIDDVLVTSSTSSPFSASINTALYTNASHTIQAKAYDAAGNIGTNSVSVTFNNLADTTPPSITITSPVSGSKIKNNTQLKVTATDNKAVVKVEQYVDGILKKISTSSPFTTTIDYKPLTTGSHSVYCKAYDAAGNGAQSQTITIIK